ncbi:MAG TPA: protein kinase [Planctomycetota bacterium]|nr:protein kinase [Planctomycetota bacterium]
MTEEGRLIGAHRVLGVLGRGGMGTVLRARSPDGTEVAIKVLRATAPQAIARFEREARLLAALGEGFVPVLETGTSDGFPYLVMPLLAGGTLEEKLRRGPLAVEEAVRLAATLARALGVAHANGIVHRDLKPSNVLFGDDDVPLIADLGLAKHFDREAPGASASISLSKTGMARGTFGYMAPEQLKDAKNVGPPADVFSLGTILYECLAGRPPFAGDSHMAIVDATVKGHFEPLEKARPDTPLWVRRLVARALLPDPRARFQDGAELARALEAGETRGRRLWPVLLVIPVAALVALLTLRRTPRVEAPPPTPPPAVLPAPFDRVQPNGRLRLSAAWGDPAWDVTGCHALVFTPDGRRVIAAGEEAVWVMDAATGILEKTIEPGHGEVGACACSPDGKLLLVASGGRPPPPAGRFQPYPSGPPCVQLWELESGRLVRTLEEVASSSVAFSARGALALATVPDGGIRVFDVATGKPLATLGPAPSAPAGALSTGPPGSAGEERVLAGGAATVRLWDPVSGSAVDVEGHPGGTGPVALFADRRRAVTGGNDGAVRIWDLATGESSAIAAHQGSIVSLALATDERTLVTSGRDGTIRIWNLATRAARATISRPGAFDQGGLDYFKTAGPVAISPDGKRVVASAWDYRLRVYDLDGKLLAGGAVPGSQVPGLAVDPRARFVATGSRDGSVLVRDPKGALVKTLDARGRGLVGRLLGRRRAARDRGLERRGRRLERALLARGGALRRGRHALRRRPRRHGEARRRVRLERLDAGPRCRDERDPRVVPRARTLAPRCRLRGQPARGRELQRHGRPLGPRDQAGAPHLQGRARAPEPRRLGGRSATRHRIERREGPGLRPRRRRDAAPRAPRLHGEGDGLRALARRKARRDLGRGPDRAALGHGERRRARAREPRQHLGSAHVGRVHSRWLLAPRDHRPRAGAPVRHSVRRNSDTAFHQHGAADSADRLS